MDTVGDDRGADLGTGEPWAAEAKVKVEWKAAAGESFPSEDDKDKVVFASYFEHGFNIPTGDFF